MHRSFAWWVSAAVAHAGLRMTNQNLRRRTPCGIKVAPPANRYNAAFLLIKSFCPIVNYEFTASYFFSGGRDPDRGLDRGLCCEAARASFSGVGKRRGRTLEFGAALAGELSHAICGTGFHSLDRRGGAGLCLFQEPCASALLCWIRVGVRAGRSESAMEIGAAGVSGVAADRAHALAGRAAAGRTLRKFGRSGGHCDLGDGQWAELVAVWDGGADGGSAVPADRFCVCAVGANCEPADGPGAWRLAGLLMESGGQFGGGSGVFCGEAFDAAAGGLAGSGALRLCVSAGFAAGRCTGRKPRRSSGSAAAWRSGSRYRGLVDALPANPIHARARSRRRGLRRTDAG